MKRLCAVVLLAGLQLMAGDGQINRVGITAWDNVLPQIADGNGWSTRIMLVNMDSTQAGTFTLYFYKEDGTQWPVDLKDRGPVSYVSGTIPVGGSLFLETMGTASETGQGWAYLSTQYWISGMAVFKADWPGTYAEGVVPFAGERDIDFFIPFDNRNGYVTSIALVNPYNTATANVQVQFRNPDGTVIQLHKPDGTVVQSDTIPLAALQHTSFKTTDKYPETLGLNGVIEFVEPSGTVFASGLGLLFSPLNTFTSIHSVSVDACYYYGCP